MGFYPHQILQDSYEFYASTQTVPEVSLAWTYSSERPFLVHADRGSFQRLLFICLDKYIHLQNKINFTFSFAESAQGALELFVSDAQGVWGSVAEQLRNDPQSKRLLANQGFRIESHALILQIEGVAYEQTSIDFPELIKKFDNADDARLMLDLFFESAEDRLDGMERAFRAGDAKLAHRIVHSFKGSALNIAAPELGAVCKDIETKIKSFGMVTVVTEDLDQIRAAFVRVKLAWQRWQKETLNAGN